MAVCRVVDSLPAVLVAESHTVGSLAVIRSLGRAGYTVVACSYKDDAIGFQSRYTTHRAICPDYDSPAFEQWLSESIEKYAIKCVVPSEGMLLALRDHFSKYRELLPFSHDEDIVYRGMSKYDLFASFEKADKATKLHENLPAYVLVSGVTEGLSEDPFARMGDVIYFKFDSSYAKNDTGGDVVKVENVRKKTEELCRYGLEHFDRFVVQAHAPGQGVGVFFLRWNNELIASFMHRRLHEVPYTGGASSFRETWHHQKIFDDALARLNYLDWQGVAMFEYRWDEQTDRFYLMELNGRFWGSLHLALFAGVDFPKLLVDAFSGRQVLVDHEIKKTSCRLTFPKEILYVWSCIKSSELTLRRKLWVIIEFMLLSVDPRVKTDFLFPNDRLLYFRMIPRAIKSFME